MLHLHLCTVPSLANLGMVDLDSSETLIRLHLSKPCYICIFGNAPTPTSLRNLGAVASLGVLDTFASLKDLATLDLRESSSLGNLGMFASMEKLGTFASSGNLGTLCIFNLGQLRYIHLHL